MTEPLYVFGLDAGDPDWLEEWVAAGHLPTIGSIMRRGAYARTRGAELISEHGVWVALLTGVPRSRHGYYYFRQLVPGTYDLATVDGSDFGLLPFWGRLDDGRSVAIIDAPDIEPLPGLAGVQLSHWATHNNWDPDHYQPATEPPGLLGEVQRRFGHQLVTREVHDSTPARDRALREELLGRVRTKGELCRHFLTGRRFDLVVVVFGETHTAAHQFWRYGPAVPDPVREPGLEEATLDVYRAVDREIATLLETLPGPANVAILTSVGLRDDFPTEGLAHALLKGAGYQPAPPPGRSMMDLARRLVPEAWREALGRRIMSREARERLLARAFRGSTDWGRAAAFVIPSAYTSFIRVNLAGREPLGTVAPGAEYEEVLDRLETDLCRLVDPETGEPAVVAVHRATRLFGVGPPDVLPDLFVEWKPGRWMSRVVHPELGTIEVRKPDFFRRSDHHDAGFVALAGPSVAARGRQPDVDALDLAPTFLSLLGESVPDELPGSPRADLTTSTEPAPAPS